MISFIVPSEPSRMFSGQQNICYRTPVMCTAGDLTSLLTLTRPESRRCYPYFPDEKDKAEGQNFYIVLESVNDETRLGLSQSPAWSVPLVMVSVRETCLGG